MKVHENVIKVIEALLRRALREDDDVSSGQGGADGKRDKRMYATTRDMDDLLLGLVSTLNDAWSGESSEAPPGGIAEGPSPGAFTLFVLNPRRMLFDMKDGDVYGYRCGLSPSHMNDIAKDPGVLKHAREVEEAETLKVRAVVEALEDKVRRCR